MITYKMIKEAQEQIITAWGEEVGARVIEECHKVTPLNKSSTPYVNEYCTACGGNWGGMLLSGIKVLYPDVWWAIPEDMGVQAFAAICAVLILCGIDTSK